MEKTKDSFFDKPSKKDDIPLRLPKLIINNYEIQREESMKFFGVLLDQYLTWKEYIKLTEDKIAKNISILYKAPSKHLLVLKTSSTLLQRNNFTSSKTSSRRLGRRKIATLKTS